MEHINEKSAAGEYSREKRLLEKTIKNFFSKNWERKSDEMRLFNLVLRDTHCHALPLFHMVINFFLFFIFLLFFKT
jgi:hypothetical protein